MAVEREFARANGDAQVDALNLFVLCSRASPHWRRRDRVIETINRKINRFVIPAINGRDITGKINLAGAPIPPLPESYAATRAYEIAGAKIGLATLSSASSLTTIERPSALSEFGAILKPAWKSAHISQRIGQAVRDLHYDRIVIFNGRHCYSRPFCDAVEDGGAEVIRYEQGSAGNRYIAAAAPVQSPAALAQLIDQHAFDAGAADLFFRQRMEKNPASEVSLFTARQTAGSLPPEMVEGGAVSFFTSSSDEMLALSDDPPFGSFANQYAVALALADACRAHGLQLLVRLHPHLRFKHAAWKREWNFDELARRGALVLHPEDASDSYAIAQTSKAVVTTGSTVGIEAAYLGIPSAVVGDWVGGRISACVVTRDRDELATFISDPRLPAGAREGALKFGSFYRTAGELLPELDVGTHPNFARIGGRIVDPVRFAAQKARFLFRPHSVDPSELDIRSGIQGGRVVLAPGTDYSSAYGKVAMSGGTNARRASTEKSVSGE